MTRVLLWGDTQTGKTSLLSAAFCSDARRVPGGVDLKASHASIAQHLWPNWQRLKQGQPVVATQETSIRVPLVRKDGSELVFEDIRGGIVQTLDQEDVRTILRGADGYLVLIEWQGTSRVQQLTAVEMAWPELQDKPRALVFTKCDRDGDLYPGHPFWTEPASSWFETLDWLTPFRALLDLFGEHVYLSSAVGYHEATGAPAQLLGEFGQLIPYRVRPINVVEPVDAVLHALPGAS